MNVTLIGMPGAGKSYFGKQVAEKLGMVFFDSDEKLIESYGKPVQEILDEKGENFVLDAEARITIEKTRGRDGLVISPGAASVERGEACRKKERPHQNPTSQQ
jgi:shikimate kinase